MPMMCICLGETHGERLRTHRCADQRSSVQGPRGMSGIWIWRRPPLRDRQDGYLGRAHKVGHVKALVRARFRQQGQGGAGTEVPPAEVWGHAAGRPPRVGGHVRKPKTRGALPVKVWGSRLVRRIEHSCRDRSRGAFICGGSLFCRHLCGLEGVCLSSGGLMVEVVRKTGAHSTPVITSLPFLGRLFAHSRHHPR